MTSLRALLRRHLLIGLSVLFVLLGTGLFLVMRRVLVLQFDEGLQDKARFLSMLVKSERDGDVELDFDDAPLPEFRRAHHPEYFVLRRADGTEVARSASLERGTLPAAPRRTEASFNLTLPDGRPGRAVSLRFVPRREHDEGPPPATPPVSLVVARDRKALDRALWRLTLALAAAGLVLTAGGATIVTLTVGRGLRPLGAVADRAATIDARTLGVRFPTEGMPAELRAICERLNDLLARVGAAFERERRFSADVAHELRTPLAELKSAAEVALRWPDERDGGAVLGDVLEAATQMERLVTTLLSLARCEGGRQPVTLAAVDLAALVREVWAPLETIARGRSLSFTLDAPGPATVSSDRALLAAMLTNVLANAADYATDGTEIACAARRDGDRWELRVSNRHDGLGAADLPHLFEPFWRKDAARSGGAHSGLGLSLVAAYARLVDAQVSATLPEPGRISVAFRLPAAPSAATPEVDREPAPGIGPGRLEAQPRG
jgi:two-component system sensor histidine kinase QseC